MREGDARRAAAVLLVLTGMERASYGMQPACLLQTCVSRAGRTGARNALIDHETTLANEISLAHLALPPRAAYRLGCDTISPVAPSQLYLARSHCAAVEQCCY